MAITDLDLKPWEFWQLTWYEWGIYCYKVYKDSQRELSSRELTMEMTRQFMALYANSNRTKNSAPITPQDFWKLSYDQNVVEEKPLSWKEAKALLGSKIKKAGDGSK